MMLAKQLRGEIAPKLPQRTFLRRARTDDLFVTNADIAPENWVVRRERGCTFLTPSAQRLNALMEALPEGESFFARSLCKTRGWAVCDAARRCFIRGIKLCEHASKTEIESYEKEVRALAALCLRNKQGGAHACAVLLEQIAEELL